MTEHTSNTTEKKLEKRVETSIENRIRNGEYPDPKNFYDDLAYEHY